MSVSAPAASSPIEAPVTLPTPVGTITLTPAEGGAPFPNGASAAAAAAPAVEAAPAPVLAAPRGYVTQREVLLDRLVSYFSKDDFAALDKVLPIINREDEVSLRLVDWFVTNYAKKTLTTYLNHSGRRFVVHNEYKLRLRSYKKKQFDPFCRWDRIEIPYRDDTVVTTTVGQLNFFKWALENKVIDFIRENQKAIESDMNARNSTARAKPAVSGSGAGDKTRRKRQELTSSRVKGLSKQPAHITVEFN